MIVKVEYTSQIKRAVGLAQENYTLEENETLEDLLLQIASRNGEKLQSVLFDENGSPSTTVLIFVQDEQANRNLDRTLFDNDTVTFLSPISGG